MQKITIYFVGDRLFLPTGGPLYRMDNAGMAAVIRAASAAAERRQPGIQRFADIGVELELLQGAPPGYSDGE